MSKVDILLVGVLPDWDLIPMEQHFNLHKYYEATDKKAFLKERADIIRGIATRGDLGANKEMIEALPKVEIISVYGVGYDAVDLPTAKARGIRVTNTPDVLTNDVADLGVTMMLAASRGVIGAEEWARSGNWAKNGMYKLQTRVYGKRVGIVGLGRIGREVAKRCDAFGMDIAYSDQKQLETPANWKFISDLKALAERSDYLFVTLTGGPATKHIISKEVIEALGSEGMLINISRASNIDEGALLDALESKKLGYAALDVFEGEPNFNPRFLKLDNVMIQPHHASGTIETRKDMGKLVRDNLIAHFEKRELLTPVI